MSEVIINYKEIIKGISDQIHAVWNALSVSADSNIADEIKNIKNIEISDEQNFVKKENILADQSKIYIVVKFGAGSINFGSSVCPISLMCLGTANKIKPIQLLMSVFASSWTTKNVLNLSDVLQVWNTPEVMGNFTEVNIEFRNLVRLTGNIVVGPAAIRMGTMTYIYDEDLYDSDHTKGCEEISIMSFQDGYQASLDTQPFGNTDGFAKSEVNFSTYSFTISTYLLTGHFSNDLLAIRGFRYRPNDTYDSTTSKFEPNQWMKLKLVFTNGYTNMPGDRETKDTNDSVKGKDFFCKFKVVNSRIGQELAGLPTLVATFTH